MESSYRQHAYDPATNPYIRAKPRYRVERTADGNGVRFVLPLEDANALDEAKQIRDDIASQNAGVLPQLEFNPATREISIVVRTHANAFLRLFMSADGYGYLPSGADL